jgi:ABC-2 type transport system ATP-binding protein
MEERLAISTSGLSKTFRRRFRPARALDQLTLNVPRGSVYGFLGRNGAGKTTTMKILLGLSAATAGRASVLGFDVKAQHMAILQRTAFVGERKVLYDALTPAELVRFTAGFYPNWRAASVEKYARRFDIPMNKRYGKLSHGNRSKVCLMLALAQAPELLMLDEPTIGLDPVVIDEVLRALIDDHVNEGATVFFSSHQLAEVEQICDWVGIVDVGRMLLETRLDDLKTNFRMVTASGNRLPAATDAQVLTATQAGTFTRYLVAFDAMGFVNELRAGGAEVLEPSGVTLRDVFLELIRKEDACTSGNVGVKPEPVSL